MPKKAPQLLSAPSPIGPYSVATEAGGLVFLSGQLAIDPTGLPTPEAAADQTRVIMENILAILGDLGLGMADVVKATIFLTDMGGFAEVNEVYGSYFENEPPARSTVGVATLPRPQFKVEIELIAAR